MAVGDFNTDVISVQGSQNQWRDFIPSAGTVWMNVFSSGAIITGAGGGRPQPLFLKRSGTLNADVVLSVAGNVIRDKALFDSDSYLRVGFRSDGSSNSYHLVFQLGLIQVA